MNLTDMGIVRVVEVKLINEKTAFINPRYIASIHPRTEDTTTVVMQNGSVYIVDENYKVLMCNLTNVKPKYLNR